MDKYVEAYGAVYNKLLFFAVRFKKPIIRVRIKDSTEKIDSPDILVLYSNKPVFTQSNTLTFVVKAPCRSDAISVETGEESDLLLSLLKNYDIFNYCFYNSVLYGCGTRNTLSFTYKTIPKTAAFKALYKITKAYQNKHIHIDHFVLCHYFKRNILKWEKWNSWWYFIKSLVNNEFKISTGMDITLKIISHIKKIWKASLKVVVNESELGFCEIALDDTDKPGILCASKHSNIYYVSPMIVSKQFLEKLPIKDKNNISCDFWFPLFTNRDNWFKSSIYFYASRLAEYNNHFENILKLLNNTQIEKYKLIQKNITLISNILTNKMIK